MNRPCTHLRLLHSLPLVLMQTKKVDHMLLKVGNVWSHFWKTSCLFYPTLASCVVCAWQEGVSRLLALTGVLLWTVDTLTLSSVFILCLHLLQIKYWYKDGCLFKTSYSTLLDTVETLLCYLDSQMSELSLWKGKIIYNYSMKMALNSLFI